MLKQLFLLILEKLDEREEKGSVIEDKIVNIIEEINGLEVKHAQALADVERWGDITDTSDWRTVELNRIKRVIQAKEKMIETLTKHG